MKIVIIIIISIFLGLCGKKVAGDSKQLPILKICTESLVQAIPPMWCWKEGGDFGIIPKDCPKGYDRHFEMCFEKCKEGYRFSFGVCVKQCDEGYKEKAIICYKAWNDWYFKRNYSPDFLTNFNEKVPCPDSTYKFGALCYRDCNLIEIENCGI